MKEKQTDLTHISLYSSIVCAWRGSGVPTKVKGGMYTHQQDRNPKHGLTY